MKRIALIAIAGLLIASTATIAFADDTETESSETKELSDAQLLKVQLLADYIAGEEAEEADVEAAAEELIELRTGETVVGWGAMFKLLQLAKATDVPLADLLEEIGDDGWGFGKRFKALNDEERERLEGKAKNLGQLKKQEREAKATKGTKP